MFHVKRTDFNPIIARQWRQDVVAAVMITAILAVLMPFFVLGLAIVEWP